MVCVAAFLLIQLAEDVFTEMDDLNSTILKQITRFRKAVPLEVRFAACLHRLTTRALYFLVGDCFGIGETTVKEYVVCLVARVP
ncbi:hypothetical protein R1sor_008788 [Riccia sorocarpa]|uniref:Uncharacterized protein n=1 Tax=Riccia sorocarpa TaxID=122646 RepID=A0ABD3HX80_9MARC